MNNDLKEYLIKKLTRLRNQTILEDKTRGKKRYVSKQSAYKDLIKLVEEYL